MDDHKSHTHSPPSDLVQIPIVWRYELLRYLRSKRLYASLAITVIVLALLYALPPLLRQPYSGTDTRAEVTVVDLSYLGLPPGTVPFESIGLLNRTGVHTDTLVLYKNGVQYPKGPTTWLLAGDEGAPRISIAGISVLLFFAENVTGDSITATYDWSIPVQEFDSLFLNFANILVIICATFFGADSVVGEFQNRTGYLMFPNPLKREVLFAGKFAASITAGAIVVGLFYAGVVVLSLVTAGGLDDDFATSFGFAVEYLLAAMAIAYLISSVLKGSTGATVLTFFMFIMILPIVDSVSIFSGVKIEGSVTFAAGVIVYILSDPYPVDSSQSVAGFTFSNFYPDPALAAITMFVYAAAALLIALLLFKRKQLAG